MKQTARKAPAAKAAARGGVVRKQAVAKAAAKAPAKKVVGLQPAAPAGRQTSVPRATRPTLVRVGGQAKGAPASAGKARKTAVQAPPQRTPRPRTPATGLRGVTNLAVLAPVRKGLVASFEPISYVERLRKVLDALQSARENLRESELLPSFFVDTIGQLDIIHHFRYALVQPQGAQDGWHLSLNVTFDGGWEPYMRVIYRDIGPLLDLLFCHNATYPGSNGAFTHYCDWVRANEMGAGFFYSESEVTLQDQRYLAAVEKLQREGPAKEIDFARLALPSDPARHQAALAKAAKDPVQALVLPLRTLKGLHRLSVYFPGDPANPKDEAAVLRRFTQSVLAESMLVMRRLDQLPAGTPERQKWDETRRLLHDELTWLDYANAVPPARPAPDPCDPTKLQSHLLASKDETVTHGCVVLLRVRKDQGAQAAKTLAALADRCALVARGDQVAYTVAFTYAGLEQLGIAQERLEDFPQEFYEGMEARHAILGDLRGNHPDHWRRPPLWRQESSGQGVDLHAVHVVIQLRRENPGNSSHELDPDLRPLVEELDAAAGGLRVLAVEPLRSYRNKGQVTGHLNVADGLSQPEVLTTAQAPDAPPNRDLVNSGELLLGRRDERGDRFVDVDELLQDGSFLVVRKLRQRMDHLDAALAQIADPAQRDEVLAKMIGRRRDGTPLADPQCPAGSNAFDYQAQAASDACPFHSHARRSNPRDGRSYTPRILRRGMSYGPLQAVDPQAERGVMFMAYCGSIAEQFETIQRWVAGGNSSGVGSAQGDPMLRVPQQGEPHTFRYIDAQGQVARFTFDDKPLVELQWGLYLFVPSLPVLENLARYRSAPRARPAPVQRPAAAQDDALEAMRAILEDRTQSAAYWEQVRARAGGTQKTAYGTLVGTAPEVMKILHDGGRKYSVQGYGKRMAASVGDNILGMDDAQRQDQLVVRQVLESVTEQQAFDLTLQIVPAVLQRTPDIPGAQGDIERKPIDLVSFSDYVLAFLCGAWFGLPQDPEKVPDAVMVPGGRLAETTTPARCPGHLLSASRYIFTPHPHADIEQAGQQQGKIARKAVTDWLASKPDLAKAPLTQAIRQGLRNDKLLAVNIAGILLGFPPTVQPNFLRVMEKWITRDAGLWERQQDLFEVSPDKGVVSYAQAASALRDALFATLAEEPVPGMLWRCPVGAHGKVDFTPEKKVVLGISSALADGAPRELVFGRDADTAPQKTVHGCPGYPMAMGVLLGMIAGLMKAGTLRPTGSPVLLILTPNK